MATKYVSFSTGSDANTGNSIAQAWKLAPWMVGFAGSYSHAAGDIIYYRIGDTWPASSFQGDITVGGSSGNNDYHGTTPSFTTGSGTRAIFDGAYTATSILYLNNSSYLTFENLEFKRITAPSGNYALFGGNANSNIMVRGCYFHGWRRGGVADEAGGGIYFNNPATGGQTIVLDNTEVENSENIGIQMSGTACRAVGIFQNGCRIHDNSSLVLDCISFINSYLYNAFGNSFGNNDYHTNGLYWDPQYFGSGVNYGVVSGSYFYNSYSGANLVYPNVRGSSCVMEMYNNVLYGNMSDQLAVEIEAFQYAGEGAGTFNAYNNTIYNFDVSKTAFHLTGGAFKLGTLNLYNNHVINASSLTDASAGSNVNTYNNGTNLSQTAATATGQGYVLGNLYAPTSTSGSTYNTGTSESGTFTVDILGVPRPQGGVWDIGAYEYLSGGTGGNAITKNLRKIRF